MPRFIISIALFLLINLLALKGLAGLDHRNKSSSNNHTWTEWALLDFEKQKSNQGSIVFLGSSLMLMPLNLADARFVNRTLDGAIHHKSDLFDCMINADRHTRLSNFDFALPGLMPSDAYLITKLVLSDNAPQLIIYGVGPRDFLDNLLLSPSSTDPYHCLSNRLPASATSPFIGKDWQSHLSTLLEQFLPLYKQREIIVDELPSPSSLYARQAPPMTIQNVHKILPHYNPMCIGLNECLFTPNRAEEPDRFAKNLNEYRQRYQEINWQTFSCQTKFFLDLLKQTSIKRTKILIAAMPITSVNRQLLPDYVYAAYKQNLRVLSKTYSASFIDLDSNKYFSDNDFMDTVHLNSKGGNKLVHLLANFISEHKLLEREKDYSQLANTGIKI